VRQARRSGLYGCKIKDNSEIEEIEAFLCSVGLHEKCQGLLVRRVLAVSIRHGKSWSRSFRLRHAAPKTMQSMIKSASETFPASIPLSEKQSIPKLLYHIKDL
jgi:hypothetical protein